MTTVLDTTTAVAVVIAILLFFWLRGRGPSTTLLPPGPKKLPVLGNLLDIPTERQWLKFAMWGGLYGNLVSVSAFGQQYIIINSSQIAIEMLEKKSHIYSDRPVIPMGGELVGWKDALGLLPYGQRFRSYRKMIHQVIGTHEAMSKFHRIEELETHRFLKLIQTKPEELASHIRRTAGAIILRISYGYKVDEGTDPFVSIADEALEQFSLSTAPGIFLVNVVPSMRYLPDWFPGAGFKQTARAWRQTLYTAVEGPYKFVMKQLDMGTAEPSMLSNLLRDESNLSDSDIYDVKWACASLYAGGADTTVSAIYAFFKAMVLYPDVQAQAQAEIDAIIGNNRLPTVEDREKLPFLSALTMEVLRWHVVGPIGIPHCAMEDDIHDGYLIPKGASIITNIWKMAHDPDVYQEPMEFNPARFIKTENHQPEQDPRELCFGFGRRYEWLNTNNLQSSFNYVRICPGRVLADISVFLSCAMTLAVFNITPHVENGIPVMPDLTQSTGIISHPSTFKCTITPRSQKALQLINTWEAS